MLTGHSTEEKGADSISHKKITEEKARGRGSIPRGEKERNFQLSGGAKGKGRKNSGNPMQIYAVRESSRK